MLPGESGDSSGTSVSATAGMSVRLVELPRDPTTGSLGLSIAGGRDSPLGDMPIMVASLAPGGSADLAGNIQVSASVSVHQPIVNASVQSAK